ncbi:MAG: glutamine synthetase family protein [Gammaproteobacteria bacterium]|nr:glutamine synthetase family protein [Gammaproteobacteria bacterium]
MIDNEQLHPPELAALLTAHPNTRYIDALLTDLCGIVRGKRLPIALAGKLFNGGMAAPGSVFLLAVTGDSQDPMGMGFSDGDPDQLGFAVPGTVQPVPWATQPTAQAMLTFRDVDGTPFYYEPRNVLKRVLQRFADLELTPVVAFELEFYLLDTERDASGLPQPPAAPATGLRPASTQVYGLNELDEFADFLAAVDTACEQQHITCQAGSSELAPGQFEINLNHRPDALGAADDCALFKRAVQGVARRHGYGATFMAKPFTDHSGSGMHAHISLLNSQGDNVFDGGGASGSDASISTTLRQAIGGLMDIMFDGMGLWAPNVNAYRRFRPMSYVPVTPSWGFENRSVAARIPVGEGNARRMEFRVAGADANPYLVLASVLAGIHYGITEGRDCGAAATGNAGAEAHPELPMQLRPALERLRTSRILNDYLGATYLEAYCACKTRELDAFEQHISPREYDWYLLT